jgi:hypothetical protein
MPRRNTTGSKVLTVLPLLPPEHLESEIKNAERQEEWIEARVRVDS